MVWSSLASRTLRFRLEKCSSLSLVLVLESRVEMEGEGDEHEDERRWCYLAPGGAVMSLSITASRLKLAGFCRMGNSLKLASQFPTTACEGTMRNARSAIH